MLIVCAAVLRRDLKLALRRRADLAAALSFFVMSATLFPLAAGSDPALLRSIGPAVVWVAALLASTLSLRRLLAGMLLTTCALWAYCIASALMRLRAIVLERERHTDWVRAYLERGA